MNKVNKILVKILAIVWMALGVIYTADILAADDPSWVGYQKGRAKARPELVCIVAGVKYHRDCKTPLEE